MPIYPRVTEVDPVFTESVPRLSPGETYNIGMKYSSPTLTICQADGTDFADTDGNRGYICIANDGTPGQSKTLVITSNATITDGDAGQLGSNSWGITTTANWANDKPSFLYGINFNNTTAYFGISDDPTKAETPATVYYKNVGGANTQASMLCMTDSGGDDLSACPCTLIGALRIQWTT